MKILRDKTLERLRQRDYEAGLYKGYLLGWQMGQVEKKNKALIEAEQILKERRE